MANNLYFPAIDFYNNLTKDDLFAFYPIQKGRKKFEGSIDGLPRKTTFANIIDFISENIEVTAEAAIEVSVNGTSIGTEFTSLNFLNNVTVVDSGSGQANITLNLPSFTDTNFFNTDLTLAETRSHDLDDNDFSIINSGSSLNIVNYDSATSLIKLGTDTKSKIELLFDNSIQLFSNVLKTKIESSLITFYGDVLLSNGYFEFQNVLSQRIRISPPSSGVANVAYTLPATPTEGFLKNSGVNQWSWEKIKFIADLDDVSELAYLTTGHIFLGTLSDWETNKPSFVNNPAWFTNFQTGTYVVVYDPVNDIWRPTLAYDVIQYLLPDNPNTIYSANDSITANRIVNLNNFDLSFYDVINGVNATNFLRIQNHRVRANDNDIQIGYYSAASSVAKNGGFRWFPRNTTNSGVEDAYIIRYSGENGNFHIANKGTGELWLQNANSGPSNKIILKNDGAVQFNSYGSGTFTDDSASVLYHIALDSTGNIKELPITPQTATGDGTTTIDWNQGNAFHFTFGAFNETFTFTAPPSGTTLVLKLTQDGTGSRTATWPATVKWPNGTAPTLSTAAGSVDIISFYFDGTNYNGSGIRNLQ